MRFGPDFPQVTDQDSPLSPEHLLILAIVQGLTEFLPVSSSGHLNLVHLLTDLPDEGPVIDVAIHVGSLAAVMLYFWRDVRVLFRGAVDLVRARLTGPARLVLFLGLASIPLLIVGFILIKTGLVTRLRTLEVIAWTTVVFGVLLWFADRFGERRKDLETSTLGDALWIGLSQVFALVPGVSRSGITISMARLLGFERTEAARYSMLLAIPAILATGGGTMLTYAAEEALPPAGDIAISVVLSFAAAFVSIWFMMALLKRISLTPFVIYRLVLGLALMWVAYA